MNSYRPVNAVETGDENASLESTEYTNIRLKPWIADVTANASHAEDVTPLGSPVPAFERQKTKNASRGSSRDYRKIRSLTSMSVSLAEKMIRYAKEDSKFDVAIAGNELVATLQQLWKLKGLRNREWQKGLNFIQSALAKVVFEKLDSSSLPYIHEAVCVLESSELENDDVQLIKRKLKLASLDPWKAISTEN